MSNAAAIDFGCPKNLSLYQLRDVNTHGHEHDFHFTFR
jgi:hypothetical protein